MASNIYKLKIAGYEFTNFAEVGENGNANFWDHEIDAIYARLMDWYLLACNEVNTLENVFHIPEEKRLTALERVANSDNLEAFPMSPEISVKDILEAFDFLKGIEAKLQQYYKYSREPKLPDKSLEKYLTFPSQEELKAVYEYETRHRVPLIECLSIWIKPEFGNRSSAGVYVPSVRNYTPELFASVLQKALKEQEILPSYIEERNDGRLEQPKEVQTNVGTMPIEDYREIRAMQWGFESYADMYNQGYRLGDGDDIAPESSAAPLRQSYSIRFAKRQVYNTRDYKKDDGKTVTLVNVALPKGSKYAGYYITLNKQQIHDDKFSPKMAFASIFQETVTLYHYDKETRERSQVSISAEQLKQEFKSWKKKEAPDRTV